MSRCYKLLIFVAVMNGAAPAPTLQPSAPAVEAPTSASQLSAVDTDSPIQSPTPALNSDAPVQSPTPAPEPPAPTPIQSPTATPEPPAPTPAPEPPAADTTQSPTPAPEPPALDTGSPIQSPTATPEPPAADTTQSPTPAPEPPALDTGSPIQSPTATPEPPAPDSDAPVQSPTLAPTPNNGFGNPEPTAAPICEELYLGDGWCDDQNNNAFCDFDGGDCCEVSCVSTEYTCGSGTGNEFDCKDPDPTPPAAALPVAEPTTAPNDGSGAYYYFYYSDDDDNYYGADSEDGSSNSCPALTDGHSEYIGDGWCDEQYNNAGCNWDEGDCCGASCTAVERLYRCGGNGYSCRDPDLEGQPTPSPSMTAPTPMPSYTKMEVDQGMVTLFMVVIGLFIVGGLVFMYCNPCKPGGESCSSRMKDLLPTSSSGAPMRSKRVRLQEEKAIELERFNRMAGNASRYPHPNEDRTALSPFHERA